MSDGNGLGGRLVEDEGQEMRDLTALFDHLSKPIEYTDEHIRRRLEYLAQEFAEYDGSLAADTENTFICFWCAKVQEGNSPFEHYFVCPVAEARSLVKRIVDKREKEAADEDAR